MGGYAWVTLATNDSYSLGALVLAHSLRKSNTAHKLAVLITPAVSQPMREQLQTVFDVVKTVDVLDSKDEAHLALMKRPELGITFTKIHCWRLTEFEKCVFLDADTLVVRNCDELFEREEFSAAPDVSWPDCFNSGVFVYKPSVETFNKLVEFAVEKGSFDGGDQGLLNQFFGDWATEDIKKHLPFVYNLTSVAAYSYVPAFKHYGAETRIVHFIGTGKPWLQQLDPATRTITPTSGSEHLAPLLQQWWDLFCEKVHPNLSKNLEKNNDGMSHLPVEACSNTSVALTSDEPQSPRLIEPCLQYREKDDYRQHNLPYQPFDVRGSSGELLNVEFLLASVVPTDDSGEQQRQDGDELEEKDTEIKVQEESSETEQTKPEIVDDRVEEKQEQPPPPKDPFDYDTFFPDEKCINNYLEQNVVTYQPFETPREDPPPENVPLPRFLTMPEDDQRQKGNVEVIKHQPAPEPPPPPPPSPAPNTAPPQLPPTATIVQEKPLEVQKQPTPPLAEKHELPKSKSMTFIPSDVNKIDILAPPQRSIWKSQPNVSLDPNRKYSMPKLKPLLPRQNSKAIEFPIPRVTLYTEFLMSDDYKDPIDLPKDEVGFVETELKRSKSEADLKGKFGPLPYTKSPEIKIPTPKKPPLRELDNEAYDLTRCKRQLGNKPRYNKKENITSKLITPSKDKISTAIKKRKSKELSPGDGEKEKQRKRERKECQSRRKNENVDEILKRLWEFSKNYQHYFWVEAKEKFTPSEFKNFKNFVQDQKKTSQKGLLGLQDIMSKKVNGAKVRIENIMTDREIPKTVNGLDKERDKVVIPNSEVNTKTEKSTRVKNPKSQSPDRCKGSNEKQSSQAGSKNSANGDPTQNLTSLGNIPNEQNGAEKSKDKMKTEKHSDCLEKLKIPEKNQGAAITENVFDQNGCKKSTKASKNSNALESLGNGYVNVPNASVDSPNQKKTELLAKGITKHSQPDISCKSITKQPEEDSLDSSKSRTCIAKTLGMESLNLQENTAEEEKDTITVKTNTKVFEPRKSERIKEPLELIESLPESDVESGKPNKNDVKNVRQEIKKDVQEHTAMLESKQDVAGEVDNTSSEPTVAEQKTTPSAQATVEESTPKRIFTIGSPEKSTDPEEKRTKAKSGTVSSLSPKESSEEVMRTSKVSMPKPDEILCVPDFETPRSSRILPPLPNHDVDSIPQAPPSSPIATPRKARIQRKPYENGTNRSPTGKKIKMGNREQSAGIAGAIAQLNLESGGKAAESQATSAAHQEYIRRQNWETGNMDYMGRDSFENIWSKICQTLEGKELDKAAENTQSPATISAEEKTKREGAAGTEPPVSLSAILPKCPEFIDMLPSESVTGPVEDDEIIFSKPEAKHKALTNIKEEEENGGAAEGGNVKLSDILKPVEVLNIPTAAVVEEKKSTEDSKSDGKPQEVTAAPVSSASDVQQKENVEPKTPTDPTQPEKLSECTTVAIRQPISIPGAPSEGRSTAKTPAEKIAEKKLQQTPETSTEAIPLPAPESPTKAECKTVAIPYSSPITALVGEKQPETPTETSTEKTKEEKQKKGVFSKLLEMVGVTPKNEEVSKSVFFDAVEATPEAGLPEDEPKQQAAEMERLKESAPEVKAEEKKTHVSGKSGQAPMPKPARNASPKSSKNKSPSPLAIPQTLPETALTAATPTPPPELPKRRNSALLKVDESIPETPPVPEPEKDRSPIKSEVESIIEKAKTEVESMLQERRSVEKEPKESKDLINAMKLMIGEQAGLEELKVTSEEERERHKGEVVSSKLSDQILKAIPPPRRKAISESKSEASGSGGAIPKTPTPPSEKPKQKPSSIPVPPPRNKGKPSTPAPSKGKTKK